MTTCGKQKEGFKNSIVEQYDNNTNNNNNNDNTACPYPINQKDSLDMC